MENIDLSTSQLRRMLEWGIEEYQCKPPLVKALVEALVAERERSIAAEQRFNKMMSDMEIAKARASGQKPGQPKYRDGVRYAAPPSPGPVGPDGFPSRGIV